MGLTEEKRLEEERQAEEKRLEEKRVAEEKMQVEAKSLEEERLAEEKRLEEEEGTRLVEEGQVWGKEAKLEPPGTTREFSFESCKPLSSTITCEEMDANEFFSGPNEPNSSEIPQ